MSVVHEVLADLRAESDELDALVAPLTVEEWSTLTPAEGWTIAHQIAHLAWTDEVATVAARDETEFYALLSAVADPMTYVDSAADEGATAEPAALLARWRTAREGLAEALAQVPDGTKVPWFGPPMSAPSMATARLMETWAHGLDVADALGHTAKPAARVRHIVRLGVRTRNYAYVARGQQPPAEEFRVELTGPDGEQWTFGPEDAAQRVTGAGYDFALLVTRRRHPVDLALAAEGPDAKHWLTIAQAFAGPPGTDPQPR